MLPKTKFFNQIPQLFIHKPWEQLLTIKTLLWLVKDVILAQHTFCHVYLPLEVLWTYPHDERVALLTWIFLQEVTTFLMKQLELEFQYNQQLSFERSTPSQAVLKNMTRFLCYQASAKTPSWTILWFSQKATQIRTKFHCTQRTSAHSCFTLASASYLSFL